MFNTKKLLAIATVTALCMGATTVHAQSPATSEAETQEGLDSIDENGGSAEEVTINFWHHYSDDN